MRQLALMIGFGLAAVFCATPSAAVDLSAELGLVSDYRYRGYSLSAGQPALQGSLTLEHDSGAYASIWSSMIEEPGFDADIELDFIGGYWLELSDDLAIDVSATYYLYPGEPGSNYAEATALVERSAGPATLRTGFSYVPGQRATRDEGGRRRANGYLFAGASYELPKVPVTLSAEIGRERGFFDEVEDGGKWDWSLGSKLALDPLRLSLSYSGTDAGEDALVGSVFLEF